MLKPASNKVERTWKAVSKKPCVILLRQVGVLGVTKTYPSGLENSSGKG